MGIDVKRSFVLADRMKIVGDRNYEEFPFTILAEEAQKVRNLSVLDLDRTIGRDLVRLSAFDSLDWRLEPEHEIGLLHVYPRMGGREWATGTVSAVAAVFESREQQGSRIWKMKDWADVFADELPIIAFEEDGLLKLTDGSHRAVAMYLAGVTKANVWVGTQRR